MWHQDSMKWGNHWVGEGRLYQLKMLKSFQYLCQRYLSCGTWRQRSLIQWQMHNEDKQLLQLWSNKAVVTRLEKNNMAILIKDANHSIQILLWSCSQEKLTVLLDTSSGSQRNILNTPLLARNYNDTLLGYQSKKHFVSLPIMRTVNHNCMMKQFEQFVHL